jgi:transcriptional regulator with PAS, ATPase and Fis domain
MRELQNVIARALINLDREENVIEVRHLMMPFAGAKGLYETDSVHLEGTLKDMYSAWEKEVLLKMLQQTEGNKAETARRLNISIRNLYNKLHQHKLI